MEAPRPQENLRPETHRRGWWSRNWLWFVPAVLLGFALLCGGCVVGLVSVPLIALKSSQPYTMALRRVQEDRQVIARLGEPVEPSGWFPTGQIHLENGRGRASLYFRVAGPNAAARVHADARRIAGRWGLSRVEVTAEDGEPFVLDLSGGGGPGEAPRFPPSAPSNLN